MLLHLTQIAKFMGPTWGPPGSCRPQMGPMLVPWTVLSGAGHRAAMTVMTTAWGKLSRTALVFNYLSVTRWRHSKCPQRNRVHDDVIKWKHFPRYWPFVQGINRSPVNSPHEGQWRGALMFSFICVWINGWVNNRETGDLRRQCAHYDVIVMGIWSVKTAKATSHWNILYHMFPRWCHDTTSFRVMKAVYTM